MWYFAALLAVVLLVAACALIGLGIIQVCLPARLRPAASLFLGPLLGLAVLALAATALGWVGHGYQRWQCLGVLAALTGAGAWFTRRNRWRGGICWDSPGLACRRRCPRSARCCVATATTRTRTT